MRVHNKFQKEDPTYSMHVFSFCLWDEEERDLRLFLCTLIDPILDPGSPSINIYSHIER